MQDVTAFAGIFVYVVTSAVIEAYCIQSLFANMGFGKNRMSFSKTRACESCNYWLPDLRLPLSAPFLGTFGQFRKSFCLLAFVEIPIC